MDTILKIAREFIGDQDGVYRYIGELQGGKHVVEYMFTDDYMDGDIALCVGGPQYLVVTNRHCRYTDNEEYTLAMRYFSANMVDEIKKKRQITPSP